MEPRVVPPSRGPAHELWVEMTTRIALRDLHFRSGQEEAAVKSVLNLFQTTRTLMGKNPDAEPFIALADVILETVRPYTARWHALQDANSRFVGPAQRRQFREELRQLQPKLAEFADLLKEMSVSGNCAALPKKPDRTAPTLGADVPAGIDITAMRSTSGATPGSRSVLTAGDAFAAMNAAERLHVATRRGQILKEKEALLNGTGLALSGGGIRSATFCLGVVQVLAGAKLLAKFDYLSTVSGGGYLGAFLSNQFDEHDVAKAKAPIQSLAADASAAYDGSFPRRQRTRHPFGTCATAASTCCRRRRLHDSSSSAC